MSRGLRRLCTERAEEGFTLAEALIVVLVGGMLAAVAITTTRNAVNTFNSSGAMDTLKGRIQVARETALSRQRDVVISFVDADTVRFFVVNPDATQTQIDEVNLEGGTTFTQNGLPKVDDPQVPWCGDGANPFAVLNGNANLRFNSDGALINAVDRKIVSGGCLYIGKSGEATSTRALSIFGTTGQSRSFNYPSSGAGWTH